MGITVLKNNAPWGPFTRAQIEEGLGRGDFTLKYLAHAPGLKEWLPLGEVLHFVDAAAPLPPVPVTRDLPPVPSPEALRAGRPLAIPFPPPTVPVTMKDAPEPPTLPVLPVSPFPPVIQKPEVHLETAPFIPRSLAFLFDCALLFVPILLFFVLGSLTIRIEDWWKQTDSETMRQERLLLTQHFHQLLWLVAVGLGWLYGAGLESSPKQATFGKRWMGLIVTDAQGERLTFLRASGRLWAKYLSALPCFLGFMAALFSSRGLALHDRLAGTRVIRK